MAERKRTKENKHQHPSLKKLESFNIQEINLNNLKYQNMALSVRLDYLKQQIQQQQQKVDYLESQNQNFCQRHSQFFLIWQNFINDLENTHNILKKPTDDKLENKLGFCFAFLDDFYKDNEVNTEKFETFLKNISNIFQEIYIDIQRNSENIQESKINLLNQDTNDSARKIFIENREFSKKIKDLEIQLQKTKNRIGQENQSLSKQLENMNFNEQINKLNDEKEHYKWIAENLSRRLRLFGEYSLSQLNNQTQNDVPELTYNCVCGGDYMKYIQDLKINIKEVDSLKEKESIKEEKIEPEETMEIVYDEKIEEKLAFYIQQNEQLVQQKANLVKQIEESQLQENNLNEIFFKSKIFSQLVSQNQELQVYSNNLKNKLQNCQKLIKKIEVERALEIQNIMKSHQESQQSLNIELNQLKMHQIQGQTQDNTKNVDFAHHYKPLIEAQQISDQTIELLKQENQNLVKMIKEQKQKADALFKHNNELQDSQNLKDQEIIHLKGLSQDYLQMETKHSKFKDVIIELNNLVKTHNIGLKPKFDELINYVKTREAKIEYIEQKLKNFDKEIKNQKKQVEQLIQEIDLTGKNYQDILNKDKKLLIQIKDSEETFNVLAKEKFAQKSQFELEKQQFNTQLKVDADLINSQKELIQDIQQQLDNKQDIKNKLEEEMKNLQYLTNEYQKQKTDLQSQKEQVQLELEILNKKMADSQLINSEYIEMNEKLRVKLNEKSNYIDKKLNLMKNFQKNSKDIDHQLMYLEIDKYRRMIQCAICEKHEKNVILKSCNHMFCKQCVDKSIQLRQRACPLCKTKFTQEEVKNVFFN